jgi:Uma2 family endonuclease
MNILAKPAIAGDEQAAPWPKGVQRLVLTDISWKAYEMIGEALRDRGAIRLTYANGNLEIMVTSHEHEKFKVKFGRLLETLAEEFELSIEPGGNMTFQQKEIEEAMEPDQCYWIAHEAHMRDKRDWDAKADPPPDLFMEIEISRSFMDRLSICAHLGVPEIWTFDGEKIRVRLLQKNKTYKESPASPTFPGIPIDGMAPFLQPTKTRGYLDMLRAFRQWVRKQRRKK